MQRTDVKRKKRYNLFVFNHNGFDHNIQFAAASLKTSRMLKARDSVETFQKGIEIVRNAMDDGYIEQLTAPLIALGIHPRDAQRKIDQLTINIATIEERIEEMLEYLNQKKPI